MRAILITALLFAASPIVFAEPPGESTPRFWVFPSEEAEIIEGKLSGPLTNSGLNFNDASLVDVVAFLRNEYDMTIQINHRALEELGLTPELPITVNVRNVSLGEALRLMFREYDLRCVIDNDVLEITSLEEAIPYERTAIYPVADLAESIRMDDLIDAAKLVSADGTFEAGGIGVVVPLADKHLLVRADSTSHDRIAGVLKAIRAAEEFANSGDGSSDASLEHDADAEIGHAETVHEHSHEEAHSEAEHEHEAHEADDDPFGENDSDEDPFGF